MDEDVNDIFNDRRKQAEKKIIFALKRELDELRAERLRTLHGADINTAVAALHRLIKVARRDTGQSQKVADFILAWHNSISCGKWDVTDIWCLDADLRFDIISLIGYMSNCTTYPTDLVPREMIEDIGKRWRPQIFVDDPELDA